MSVKQPTCADVRELLSNTLIRASGLRPIEDNASPASAVMSIHMQGAYNAIFEAGNHIGAVLQVQDGGPATLSTPAEIQSLVDALRVEISELKPMVSDGTVISDTLTRVMQDACFKIAEARGLVSVVVSAQQRSAGIKEKLNTQQAEEDPQFSKDDLEQALERTLLQNRGRPPAEQELVRSVLDSVRRSINTKK